MRLRRARQRVLRRLGWPGALGRRFTTSAASKRAVAAAIELHDAMESVRMRLEYPLQISVGLATGEVVAGHFGSAKRMDYTVIGDAVNLANALQSAAPPGAIYCDAETIVSAGVVTREVRSIEVQLKGRTDCVTAYSIQPRTQSTRVS